ncbi:hypothetical protein RCL1_002243 [Eukaryota sp. TZLM3-RCL]
MKRTSACLGPREVSSQQSAPSAAALELKLRNSLLQKRSNNNTSTPTFTKTFQTSKKLTLSVPESPQSFRQPIHFSTDPLLLEDKHWSQKSLTEMSERDWRILREDFLIKVKGNVPHPARNWSEMNIDPRLITLLHTRGFKTPTPVQMQAVPVALDINSNDLVSIAKTGSGKTLAYLLPAFQHIFLRPPLTNLTSDGGPFVLILAPTRELAVQIYDEAKLLADDVCIRVNCLIGGQSIDNQCNQMKGGVELVVGTPGRLKDALTRGLFSLANCDYLILDEADKMIAMGFIDQVKTILSYIPCSNTATFEFGGSRDYDVLPRVRYRKTLMFSATFPTSLEDIVTSMLRNPVFLAVGQVGVVSDTITQTIIWTNNDSEKRRKLIDLLRDYGTRRTMVFVNTKSSTDSLAKFIKQQGLYAVPIHGGKSQDQREGAMINFKDNKSGILVTTDLAGRGLDIPNVELIINYELPQTIDDYVHRLGRTGRAGKSGQAFSLIGHEDSHLFYELRKMLLECEQKVPLELENHDSSHVACSTVTKSKLFTVT